MIQDVRKERGIAIVRTLKQAEKSDKNKLVDILDVVCDKNISRRLLKITDFDNIKLWYDKRINRVVLHSGSIRTPNNRMYIKQETFILVNNNSNRNRAQSKDERYNKIGGVYVGNHRGLPHIGLFSGPDIERRRDMPVIAILNMENYWNKDEGKIVELEGIKKHWHNVRGLQNTFSYSNLCDSIITQHTNPHLIEIRGYAGNEGRIYCIGKQEPLWVQSGGERCVVKLILDKRKGIYEPKIVVNRTATYYNIRSN